jgi:hypothetical protein
MNKSRLAPEQNRALFVKNLRFVDSSSGIDPEQYH